MTRKRIYSLLLTGVATLMSAGGCQSSNETAGEKGPSFREATAEDQRFLKPEPIQSGTILAAGRLAESQGRFDDAIANYREVLKQDPDHKEAIYRLAISCTLSKKVDQAVAAWQRYVQVTHGSADALANLAYTHQLAGHWKEAEVNYQRALNADATNKYARVNYGLMLANRDRVDEATVQLSKVLTPPQVEYNLGSVFELRGMNDAARKRYLEALRMDPQFREAQLRLKMMDAQAAAR